MAKLIHRLILSLLLLASTLPASVWAQDGGDDEPTTPATDHPFERATGRDAYENNYAPDQAAPIAVGTEVEANFVCPVKHGCTDQDWYAVALKGGTCYSIETDQLSSGVDTNVILHTRQGVALVGNDDRAAGDARSLVSYCVPTGASATYLVLVGPATPPPASGTYVLRVRAAAPPTPVPPTAVPPTAIPPTAAPPVPTAVPRQVAPPPAAPVLPTSAPPPPSDGADDGAGAVPVDTAPSPVPEAPPVPAGDAAVSPPAVAAAGIVVTELEPFDRATAQTAAQQLVPLTLPICYDRNANSFCDVPEGIAGVTVFVTDAAGTVLGQALSDERGVAQLTVRAPSTATLNLSLPYFAAAQTTTAQRPRLSPVIIPPAVALPTLLP